MRYRWEFEKDGEAMQVGVNGPLVLGEVPLMMMAARQGLGLAYVYAQYAQSGLQDGSLVQCWRTGARTTPASFCTTPVAAWCRRHCALLLRWYRPNPHAPATREPERQEAPNRAAERALARAASTSRLRGSALVTSEAISVRATSATCATARSNAALLASEGT